MTPTGATMMPPSVTWISEVRSATALGHRVVRSTPAPGRPPS
jgi:hypothetical protein